MIDVRDELDSQVADAREVVEVAVARLDALSAMREIAWAIDAIPPLLFEDVDRYVDEVTRARWMNAMRALGAAPQIELGDPIEPQGKAGVR